MSSPISRPLLRRGLFVPGLGADAILAELAARQHGRVAVWQLSELGVSPTEVRSRVRSGHLHREHQGVYAVGHPGTTEDARVMSAVLAAGPYAVASHRSAAHHWQLFAGPGPERVHVTAAGRTRDGHPGLVLHLPRRIARSEVTTLREVPCTTVARTLADVAHRASDDELATAVHRATVRGLFTPAEVEAQFARRIPGVGRLRRLVEPEGPDLRGTFERCFASFVRRGGWPRYQANVRIDTPLGQLRTDAYWPDRQFAVELDSWTHHGSRDSFESDRERDIAADLIGLRVLRVTWAMLHGRPAIVAAMLDRHLGPAR